MIESLEFLHLLLILKQQSPCVRKKHWVWAQASLSREETANPVNVSITSMKIFPNLKSHLGQENELIIFKKF